MSDTDAVRVQTQVRVSPPEAFRIFTEELDAWWRRDPRFRFDPVRSGRLSFEERARLVETYADGERFEVGEVLAWDPGRHLAVAWRTSDYAPGEATRVDVRFSPAPGGATAIELTHSGFDALTLTHPARRGLDHPSAFASMVALRWADQLTRLRARC